MFVFVLLYQVGKENEGIHSLEVKDKTVVLMFEEKDDAERYCGLLEAQDFPSPTVESVERNEIEVFCDQSGYEAKFVKKGFIPTSQEDRLFITPPQSNLDVTSWDENSSDLREGSNQSQTDLEDLDKIRRSLEDLL